MRRSSLPLVLHKALRPLRRDHPRNVQDLDPAPTGLVRMLDIDRLGGIRTILWLRERSAPIEPCPTTRPTKTCRTRRHCSQGLVARLSSLYMPLLLPIQGVAGPLARSLTYSALPGVRVRN